MTATAQFQDRLLSLGLARVSEAAALASARLVGHGDEKAAEPSAAQVEGAKPSGGEGLWSTQQFPNEGGGQ